ncbi:hypothetical protein MKW94_021629, partial [Papaver nudicaule]|nr:hypothetical protein [Papaver nudicaule]
NTWEAYQALISVIECFLNGRVPRHVLVGASDEVLSVLKSSFNFEYEKKQQIEKLIGSISLDAFQQLVAIAGWITDYNNNLGAYRNNHADYSGLFYKPSNEANWRSYNLFLESFRQIVGDQPDLVFRLAADSALLVLKNVETPIEYRKHTIRAQLGDITSDWFDHLTSLASMITDYPPLSSYNYNSVPVTSSSGTNFYPGEFNYDKQAFEKTDIYAPEDTPEDFDYDNVNYEPMASEDSDEEEEEDKSESEPMASDDEIDRGTVKGWMKDLNDDDFQEVKDGMKNLTVQKNGAQSSSIDDLLKAGMNLAVQQNGGAESSSSDDECERVIIGEPYLTAESCSDEEYQKVKVGVCKLTVEENSDEEWLVI